MSYKTDKRVVAVSIMSFIDHGRKEITTRKELEKYAIGSLISYTTLNGNYSKGGFTFEYLNDSFIFVTLDFTKKYKIKYSSIDKMWIGDVHKVVNDYISFKKPLDKKKIPIFIGNFIVHYVRDNYAKKIFESTERYKTMIKWYKTFNKKNDLTNEEKYDYIDEVVLGIIGSKSYTDYKDFKKHINVFVEKYGKIDRIVRGDNAGVDKLAKKYAKNKKIDVIVHNLDESKCDNKTKIIKNKMIRNKMIVNDSTHLIVFLTENNKTIHSGIHYAVKNGIKIVINHL